MGDEGRFLVAVGAVIEYSLNGKILLLKRSPDADQSPSMWEDVSGRMKQNEDPYEALRREVKEETDLSIEILKPLTVFHFFRGEERPENELIGAIFWCKTDSDRIIISEEHTDYQWVNPLEALKIVEGSYVEKDIQAFIREKRLLEP